MKKLKYCLFFILPLFFLMPDQVLGQKGSISGIVADMQTNETIIGANVIISGTLTGSATNLDGFYEIRNLDPGSYNLSVSYISYLSDTIFNVKVIAGQTTRINFKLEQLNQELQAVVISGTRSTSTEISMISAIKASNLTVSGISRQQISRSQDKNASEVLKRVPGITIVDDRFVVVRGLIERYNTVWLNNSVAPSVESDQRAFSFDIIPSSMIDRILVFKTPAPELPADFAGAAIEVYTKNFPETNSLLIGFSTRYTQGTTFQDFYQYSGGKTDWLGFDDGTRAIPNSVPDINEYRRVQGLVNNEELTPVEREAAKKAQTDWGKAFGKTSTADQINALPDYRINVEYSGKFNTRNKKLIIGNISSLHYDSGFDYEKILRASYEVYDTVVDTSVYIYRYLDEQYARKVHIGALFNWSFSFGNSSIEFMNVFNQFGKSKTTYRDGIDYYRNSNKIDWTELAYDSRTIYSGQISGKHNVRDDITNVNWTLGYAYAKRDQPDNRRIYRYAAYINDTTYAPFQLDYTSWSNTESNGRLFFELDENILTADVNFNTKFLFGNFQPSLKAGVYSENKYRDFGIRTFGILRAGTTSQFDFDILRQPVDSIYDNSNFRFYNPEYPNATAGIKIQDDTRPEYLYTAQNNLLATYLGLNLPVTKELMVYAGVRIEKMRQELEWVSEFASDTVPEKYLSTIRDTTNLFPSVNITYNINQKNLLRLAYGKSINRSEFRETAPYGFYDFELSATVYGNDSLRNAYIENFDLRYEWYPSPTEMITIGGFYKKFINPIEMNLFPASNGWDFVYSNAVDAYSLGAEIDIRKSFYDFGEKSSFLRYLKNYTLLLNASLIQSKVTSDDDYLRDKQRPMFGQSPYIVNAGIYYSNAQINFNASLLYNVIGERIAVVGTPTIPNIYELPRNLLDFTFSKGIGEHVELKGGVKDILNQPVKLIQTVKFQQEDLSQAERTQVVKQYNYGTSYMIGITYRF
ncbi:MAG TPA: TonB-dependent receptor [Bacteroidales bacterium]|nr:TonB-dependent receptor [Bacteroidales bacterium]